MSKLAAFTIIVSLFVTAQAHAEKNYCSLKIKYEPHDGKRSALLQSWNEALKFYNGQTTIVTRYKDSPRKTVSSYDFKNVIRTKEDLAANADACKTRAKKECSIVRKGIIAQKKVFVSYEGKEIDTFLCRDGWAQAVSTKDCPEIEKIDPAKALSGFGQGAACPK